MTNPWFRCLVLYCVCVLEVVIGKTTPDGRLVFFEWDAAEGAGHRSRALEGDYGMMFFYDAPPRGDSTFSRLQVISATVRTLHPEGPEDYLHIKP